MKRQTALRIARALEAFISDFRFGSNYLQEDIEWLIDEISKNLDSTQTITDFILKVYEAENEIQPANPSQS